MEKEFEPMSIESLDLSSPTLITFGATPVSNYEGEAAERAAIIAQQIIEKRYSQVIIVGNDEWIDPVCGSIWTEAAFLKMLVLQCFADGSKIFASRIIALETGNETYSQTQAIAQLLNARVNSSLDVTIMSSWHQLSRVKPMMDSYCAVNTIKYRSFEYQEEELGRQVESAMNFLLGYMYTMMLLLMQRIGYWYDGGPLIRSIQKDRSDNGNNGNTFQSNFGIADGRVLERLLAIFNQQLDD